MSPVLLPWRRPTPTTTVEACKAPRARTMGMAVARRVVGRRMATTRGTKGLQPLAVKEGQVMARAAVRTTRGEPTAMLKGPVRQTRLLRWRTTALPTATSRLERKRTRGQMDKRRAMGVTAGRVLRRMPAQRSRHRRRSSPTALEPRGRTRRGRRRRRPPRATTAPLRAPAPQTLEQKTRAALLHPQPEKIQMTRKKARTRKQRRRKRRRRRTTLTRRTRMTPTRTTKTTATMSRTLGS